MKPTNPALPINVQFTNDYQGADRGLSLTRENPPKCIRVHKARWRTNGPEAATAILEFQLMSYSVMPSTPQDYAGGALLTAPDGTQWFNTKTRGLVLHPILVDYWAMEAYYSVYSQEGAEKLDGDDIATTYAQNGVFVETMGRNYGLDSVDLVIEFDTGTGQLLTRTSAQMGVKYTKAMEQKSLTVTSFDEVTFDPVQVAIHAIKTAEA